MADNAFSKFVPGFDFLQGLVKNAGAALPGIGQWVAPTINPEELGKRIEELRTVQFWLEQNGRMLGATIQALEVQRMTLSTLQSMNVPLAQLSEALKMPGTTSSPAEANPMAAWPGVPPEIMAAAAKSMNMPAAAAAVSAAAKPASAASPAAAKAKKPATPTAPTAPALAVDPMQWWGALSQQFTQLAANAMKDTATDAAKNLAGSIVKQSFDAAGETLRKAASVPGAVAGTMVDTMAKTLTPKAGSSKTSAKTVSKAAPRKTSVAAKRKT
ncbi:PhaM family polyhydroxyalkanoate granule multifunctional regulatory protein [Paucibacter sp. AS339]|uniref:PhaM family polyhydroxyalkanoate granule multifunctional regulatory protein n=1 Tax=Paucibacter hankyongi TaxID=3133434 RepID=UPI0030B763FB